MYEFLTSYFFLQVTGGNKGIGFAIVKGLCEKFNGIVYLTARDIGRGEVAVGKLKAKGLSPRFHQLNITDQTSVNKFQDYLKSTHGGIDLLINNAAIAFKVKYKTKYLCINIFNALMDLTKECVLNYLSIIVCRIQKDVKTKIMCKFNLLDKTHHYHLIE